MSSSIQKRSSWWTKSRVINRQASFAAALAAACVVIFLAAPAGAEAPHQAISRWDAVYELRQDGSVQVRQTVEMDALAGEGLTVNIPVCYMRGYGRTTVDQLRILDADGQLLQEDAYDRMKSLDRITLLLPPPRRAQPAAWTIEYRLGRSYLPAESGSEPFDRFERMLLPEDLPYAIGQFRATMAFPEEIAQEAVHLHVSVDSVSQPGLEVMTSWDEQGNLHLSATEISPRTNIELAVGWPAGLVQLPEKTIASSIWAVVKYPYFAAPGVLFCVLLFWFLRYGRDPGSKEMRTPHYAPPHHLTPVHLGALLHERVRITFIIALLVDLAQRGYIRIMEEERRSIFSKKDYTFIRERRPASADELTTVEQFFLDALFASQVELGGQQVTTTLSTLKNHFSTKISTMRNMVMNDLVRWRYFRENPRVVRKKYTIIATLIVAVATPALVVGGILFENIYAALPLYLCAGVYFFFSPLMPQKTKKGCEAHQEAVQFKMFLHHAERYRRQQLNSELFSKYLPYAMMFGIEKSWARAFESVLEQPPDWYEAGEKQARFSATEFTQALRTSFVHAASQTIQSAPTKASFLGRDPQQPSWELAEEESGWSV